MSSSPLVDITDREIDPREVEKAVWTSADGAMVTFSGVVRDHDGGRRVHDIEYSAHPTARDTLARLCAEVVGEHSARVAAVHRVGVLPVGAVAVVVVAVAPHRAEAFAACSELIERLKHGVPIWKRQRFTDGVSEWVGVGDC
ncbi:MULTISPECIES: molybdenum cofactor biosynthesis protein MoaE [Dietzia]|jgi:molybdopterin synthase catalytic subunit|uniref:Molybdenum cofactor biosynthesis protein MoaE n=1 Tax=Dietzia maris TaxID=37915 RepID=A0ABT8GZL5_9ACTN|nr:MULTISPECIES: molybdenum cofactor biosynthesis protein MoaE [Dietzia]MDJ0421890.1 molybdenum cofactor biosynthesis protein MoaE [Dietzia kunjamensis]MDN4505154.1 molybdenum cofactor biosynthesis protein MoaE [Dietzia maris]